jgi:ligand-binding sensor domain-containing protein
MESAMNKMTRLLRYLTLLAIVLVSLDSPLRSMAQENWTTYTEADGLASHRIMTVAVASDETVWVGTLDGVSHFDGETWTTYTEDDGLASNCILSIAFAPDGAVWVAASTYSPAYYPLCTQGGVSRFDGATWTTYAEDDGLVALYFRTIVVDSDNMVWVGTHSGIFRFDGENRTAFTLQEAPYVKQGVSFMTFAPDGALWVAGYHGFAQRVWVGCLKEGHWTAYTPEDGLLPNGVEFVAVAPDGMVWTATNFGWATGPSVQGLSRFDGETWTHYTSEDHAALVETTTITISPDGSVWVGTWQHGGLHFDGETWTQYTVENGLASDIVVSIAVAPDGAVWFGTLSGVSKYWPRND